MRLSEQDAKQFFDLMWALQYFVNCKLQIHTDVNSVDEYVACDAEEKNVVRKALYGNMELVDSFVQENPQKFSEEELSIVSNWKNFINGSFYIERFIKRYAVFIRENDVYGVQGLLQSIDELVHRSQLPYYVQAVLLPFKGEIVYDGIFEGYNIHFGGGIKRDLKEIYMVAKQNNRIVESLEPIREVSLMKKPGKPLKDWKSELDKISEEAKSLRGTSGSHAICGPAFSLIKASIEFAQTAIADTGDLGNIHKSVRKAQRALNKCCTVLEREENE
ncbi:MAG: hypothetical protein GY941_08960 [Planctomycetes bacterium]|nr:hypothetical protein [Planctomycetota bacterium]